MTNQPAQAPRYHLARSRDDVPQADLDRLADALHASDDQWCTSLDMARELAGDQEPALLASIAHNIAISMLARLAMNLNRKLRIWYGWEILEADTVVSNTADGFVVMNGVMVDDHEPGIILMPEESIGSSGPTMAIRYNRIHRAELDFARHGYEGWATVTITEE
mgnify:CR=1 FL=1